MILPINKICTVLLKALFIETASRVSDVALVFFCFCLIFSFLFFVKKSIPFNFNQVVHKDSLDQTVRFLVAFQTTEMIVS